ncbi:MAG: molybdopterin dinucleotide binding domain-containing protein [Promethearchaeota archaeon]
MSSVKVKLTSGGTIAQGVATRSGSKALPMYRDSSAVLFLDESDFKELGIMRGMPVVVRSEHGEVVVYCEITQDGPHPGIGFIARGPWCNLVVSSETFSSGCAHYKETPIQVEPAPAGVKPKTMPELMRDHYIKPLSA